jgi:predicted O-linked N-acetylglucosamine transferase (SPINDLY family)
MQAMFRRAGIDEARIELKGWSDFREYLVLLQSIDIALDTFPFNGHTTTCHALWMGVPIVTRAGETHASRMGLSICESIKLGDLVAASDEDYVNKAVALARDENRLSELRAGMRHRLTEAGMLDRDRFTRELEETFARMLVNHA